MGAGDIKRKLGLRLKELRLARKLKQAGAFLLVSIPQLTNFIIIVPLESFFKACGLFNVKFTCAFAFEEPCSKLQGNFDCKEFCQLFDSLANPVPLKRDYEESACCFSSIYPEHLNILQQKAQPSERIGP